MSDYCERTRAAGEAMGLPAEVVAAASRLVAMAGDSIPELPHPVVLGVGDEAEIQWRMGPHLMDARLDGAGPIRYVDHLPGSHREAGEADEAEFIGRLRAWALERLP